METELGHGRIWTVAIEEQQGGTMYCIQCGALNADDAKFCSKCGKAVAPPAVSTEPDSTAPRTTDFVEHYKAIIGPKNQDYYLTRFKRFDERGKAGISWHWPALFFPLFWLLYRKMWKAGIWMLVAPFLIWIVAGVLMAVIPSEAVQGLIALVISVSMFLLPPIYANAIYHWHCRRRIEAVRTTHPDIQRQLGELSGAGGTSAVPVIVFGFVFVFAILGILAAIAIPAYQDYLVRAKVAEAYTFGNSAVESVANYYATHSVPPPTLNDAGFVDRPPAVVRSITLDMGGTVRITMAVPPIAGKSFQYVPVEANDGSVVWQCMPGTLKPRYLPPSCRGEP